MTITASSFREERLPVHEAVGNTATETHGGFVSRSATDNTFEQDKAILMEFLKTPLGCPDALFDRFSKIPGALLREGDVQRHERFVYVKGSRENKVLLVAHADSYWDSRYGSAKPGSCGTQNLFEESGVVRNRNGGLGADDRAGCAILWLFRESGHSLLLTDGEEHGQRGAHWLMQANKDIAEEIQNEHRFAVEFDRKNARDFKCYYVGTKEFRDYLKKRTGYTEPDWRSCTDICVLCEEICGVNLSIGYRDEHSPHESLVLHEWADTLNLCRNWLGEPELRLFPLSR